MIMLDILKINVGFIISLHYTGYQVRLTDEKSFIKVMKSSVNTYLYTAEFEIFSVTKGQMHCTPLMGAGTLDPSSNQCDS